MGKTREALQRDFALQYFGFADVPEPAMLLDQLALAPKILHAGGVPVP